MQRGNGKGNTIMSLGSNSNAILFNNCQSLKNLIVTLQANRHLITQGDNGFSLQLNCYPQTNPQATYNGYPLAWFQYVINVYNAQVQAGIQYWSKQDPKDKGHGYSPSPNYVQFASAPSNQVQRGSAMRIALETDPNVNVTSATFSITDAEFSKVSSYRFVFPSDCLCAIYGFQVNLVGPGDGSHTCTFTSAGGILTYQTLDSLAVQTTNNCGGPQFTTGETSNALYGDVTSSDPNVSQNFGF
jgi:hypothetical protein